MEGILFYNPLVMVFGKQLGAVFADGYIVFHAAAAEAPVIKPRFDGDNLPRAQHAVANAQRRRLVHVKPEAVPR